MLFWCGITQYCTFLNLNKNFLLSHNSCNSLKISKLLALILIKLDFQLTPCIEYLTFCPFSSSVLGLVTASELIHNCIVLSWISNPLATFPEGFLGKLCCVNISEVMQKNFVPISEEWNTKHNHGTFTF